MSMTIHDAIKHLSSRYKTSVDCYHTAITKGLYKAAEVHRRDMDVEQMAINALREKAEQENPRPLTLEELREMMNEPVYILYPIHGGGEWAIFTEFTEYGFDAGDETFYFSDAYGPKWVAYRHKPGEV